MARKLLRCHDSFSCIWCALGPYPFPNALKIDVKSFAGVLEGGGHNALGRLHSLADEAVGTGKQGLHRFPLPRAVIQKPAIGISHAVPQIDAGPPVLGMQSAHIQKFARRTIWFAGVVYDLSGKTDDLGHHCR